MRIALAFFLVGCIAPHSSSDVGTDTDTDTDIGTGSGAGSGSGSGMQPPAPVPSGAYQVRSHVDLTVEALLPEPAAEAVITLREFSTNPARTLLDLAEEMGVPAVAEIRDDLPSYVEDKLEGWIDGEIAKLAIDGVPVPQLAGNLAALAETALTQFALDSELVIAGGMATHTLKAIDLAPSGIAARVALDALPGEIVAASSTCSVASGRLSIGNHVYGIAYGEYVWRAVNQAVTAEYGADIRGLLGSAVSCPTLAHAIATKCYWGVCVGHEAQLTAICEAGLDEVVERVHAKFSAMRFDALHFAAGSASLVDADRDGAVEALAAGVWDAEIDAGMGLRHVPATFTATK
jgi:hypothetical protein